MKHRKSVLIGSGIFLLLTFFFGCGERSGEKEYNKGMASWKNGDLVRAQGQLEKAIRKLSGKEKRSEANNQLGIILWNLGKHDQAAEKFGESCRLSDELSGANLNLGIALFHADQLEQAEFEFTKILNDQPSNSTARSFLGIIQMQRKNWASASKEITASLRTTPNNPARQNALALAELHLNGGSTAAIKRLEQIVIAYPDYAPALYNLALIQDQWLHNSSAALRRYKQYLAKAGTDALQSTVAEQAIVRLGGKTDPARPTASAQHNPDKASRLIAAGSKLHAAKKYNAAVKQYEQALRADPTQKTAHYNMGLSYYALKDYSQAAQACLDALKIDPSFTDARYMLSLSYSQQGQWSYAEREAKTLKETDPTRGKSMLKYISGAQKR